MSPRLFVKPPEVSHLPSMLFFFFSLLPVQHNDPKLVMSCSSYLNQPMGFPGCHWLPWMLKGGSQSQQVRHMSPFDRDLTTHDWDVMRDIWGKETWRELAKYLTSESGVSCNGCGVERNTNDPKHIIWIQQMFVLLQQKQKKNLGWAKLRATNMHESSEQNRVKLSVTQLMTASSGLL